MRGAVPAGRARTALAAAAGRATPVPPLRRRPPPEPPGGRLRRRDARASGPLGAEDEQRGGDLGLAGAAVVAGPDRPVSDRLLPGDDHRAARDPWTGQRQLARARRRRALAAP